MQFSDFINIRKENKYKHLCFETENDWFIIKGSYIRQAPEHIVDAYVDFKNEVVKWAFVERRIRFDYSSNTEEWRHLNEFDADLSAIVSAYGDGHKIF